MYAHVIRSVEKLIRKRFSEEDWLKNLNECEIAGNDELYCGIVDQELFDSITQHASKLFNIEINELMEQAGRSLLDHYLESGYESIMKSIGPDLPTFLSGLDHLHEHFNYRFPGMRPPSFRVSYENNDKNAFLVHYYSERFGLDHYVVGLLKASAEVIYGHSVHVTIKQQGLRHNESTVFEVTLPGDVPSKSRVRKQSSSFETDLASDIESVIDHETFCGTFPFHLLLDKNLQIVQAGVALMRLVPQLKPGQSNFLDLFTVVRPDIEITFKGILTHINSIYHVETRVPIAKKPLLSPDASLDESEDSKENEGALRLKGQMMFLVESGTMMYFASPRIFTLDGLSEKGMYLSDIPIHDATRDLILLSEQHSAENELKEKLEDLTDKLKKTSKELEYEQKLADRLLYSILPPSVADDLRAKKPVAAKKYDLVTIMFSGIADFSSLCNNSTDAMEIVNTLNSIYIHFDRVSDKYSEVYKVETVGDKYMCVSGLPDKSEKHAHNIAHLSIDMMKVSKEVTIGGKNIVITIGIHSGEVVAGVIGRRLPRYCLFGNVVNLTSRTETTGIKGKINVTKDAHDTIDENPDDAFVFDYRGPVVMKGKKEPMICYLLREKEEGESLTGTIEV